MNNLTFLSRNDIEGENKFSIINEIGIAAKPTDFAILNGLCIDSNGKNNLYASYWLTSNNKNHEVAFVDRKNRILYQDSNVKSIGGRLLLELDKKDFMNKQYTDGTTIIYGNYPQNAASENLQIELSKRSQEGLLKGTECYYTTNSWKYSASDKAFSPTRNYEFTYQGNNYVKIQSNINLRYKNGIVLSNGCKYKKEDERKAHLQSDLKLWVQAQEKTRN